MTKQLKDKKIIFLGSSVTYGSASNGISFADFIAERNGCEIVKEALSGTTLADINENSYIGRLRALNVDSADLFICQLSTNDAALKIPLGEIGDTFDTKTVTGAVEYIISYAREKWGCPVALYTNPYFCNTDYESMVKRLYEIAEKHGIAVIDMWNDGEFNRLTDEKRDTFMSDIIHPTRAGYEELWTPYFEKAIDRII